MNSIAQRDYPSITRLQRTATNDEPDDNECEHNHNQYHSECTSGTGQELHQKPPEVVCECRRMPRGFLYTKAR
jgi:hypothetical protein